MFVLILHILLISFEEQYVLYSVLYFEIIIYVININLCSTYICNYVFLTENKIY